MKTESKLKTAGDFAADETRMSEDELVEEIADIRFWSMVTGEAARKARREDRKSELFAAVRALDARKAEMQKELAGRGGK